MGYGRRVTAFLLIAALAAAPLRGAMAGGMHMHGGHQTMSRAEPALAPMRVGVIVAALPASAHCNRDHNPPVPEPAHFQHDAASRLGAGDPLAVMGGSCHCDGNCHCACNARLAPALPSAYTVVSVPRVAGRFQCFSLSPGTFVLIKTRPPTLTFAV